MNRVRASIRAWLVALDALACVTLRLLPCWIGLGTVPSPYETISSLCGRAANAGSPWGEIAEVTIDGLFELLGSAPGHCQRSIVRADWLAAPLP